MAEDSSHHSNPEQEAWRSQADWWEEGRAGWWEKGQAGWWEREAEEPWGGESTRPAASSHPKQHSASRAGHGPPGKGCRSRRREERKEQVQRNYIRTSFGVDVANEPIQSQIRHERLVKQKAAMTQRLAPQILEEVKQCNAANQIYTNYLVHKAAAQAAGLQYFHVPPPQCPWIPPASQPSSSSSSRAPPPKWSHTSCCQAPSPPPGAALRPQRQSSGKPGAIPKTPPSPPAKQSSQQRDNF